mgnify:CR=1 FL=1
MKTIGRIFYKIKDFMDTGHFHVGKTRVDYAFIVFVLIYGTISVLVYGGYI